MLPLATPTHSGLWIDYVALAIVLTSLSAFVAGLADLCRRVARGACPIDAITLSAYAALALVGTSVAVMLAGGHGIPAAQAMFLGTSAWGLVCSVRRAPCAWRWLTTASGADRGRATAFAAAAAYSIWFWAGLFQDHVALPVAHDGITHTAYYLRILGAGVPTLGRVPIGFTAIFGMQRFEFYPTGTHALLAISSGFWGQWGVIAHAGILKACFTLTMAALPWSLAFVVRRLMPRLPWWIGLALLLAAIPGFRFPIEAAHEGGASRLFAHLLMAPIYADVLLGRFTSLRRWPLAGLVLGLAFLMHPSACVMVAALLAYSAVWAAIEDAGWRARLGRIAAMGAGIALGGLVALALLRWNGSLAAARSQAVPFSWATWMSRLGQGWTTLFLPEYQMGLVKQALIGAGLALLIVRRKALGVSARVTAFPFWIVLVAVAALSAQVVPFPGSRMLGGAFYDEVPRVIEMCYEAIGLCLAALAWSLWLSLTGETPVPQGQGQKLGQPTRDRRLARHAIAAALVIAALGSSLASRAWLQNHFRYWDKTFSTARISRLQALGTWIEKNTEPNALLFYVPFDNEIWEAWTGRRGIFMYGECHVNNAQKPCLDRKGTGIAYIDTLRAALEQPTLAVTCLPGIERFARPAYALISSPVAWTHPVKVCEDATFLVNADGHAVVTSRGGAHARE